jgi:predicted nucleotidyltransferase component of viral defense system
VKSLPQIDQEYFKLLPFKPASIHCLQQEEVVSEKVRAASQRSKIRDLHDLSEIPASQFNRDLLRSLAVIKLWESGKENLDYECFAAQIENGKDYDLNDLTNEPASQGPAPRPQGHDPAREGRVPFPWPIDRA